MKIELNKEAAAVLLRYLNCSSTAISKAEQKSGVEAVILKNVDLIRNQVCRGLSDEIIQGATK